MSKTKTTIFETKGYIILNDANQCETDTSITKLTDKTFTSRVQPEPYEDALAIGKLKEVTLTISVNDVGY